MREEYRVGGLLVDTRRYEVRVDDGPPIMLTPAEWDVLLRLVRDPGMVLSSRQLVSELQYPDDRTAAATVKTYIRRLRRKLGDIGESRRFIHTRRGFGWMVEDRKL